MTDQHKRIASYIDEFGSITPIEAFQDLGITKLATRVSEMKRAGIEFKLGYVPLNGAWFVWVIPALIGFELDHEIA